MKDISEAPNDKPIYPVAVKAFPNIDYFLSYYQIEAYQIEDEKIFVTSLEDVTKINSISFDSPYEDLDEIYENIRKNQPIRIEAYLYFDYEENQEFFNWCMENKKMGTIWVEEETNRIAFESKEAAVLFKMTFDTIENPKKQSKSSNDLEIFANRLLSKNFYDDEDDFKKKLLEKFSIQTSKFKINNGVKPLKIVFEKILTAEKIQEILKDYGISTHLELVWASSQQIEDYETAHNQNCDKIFRGVALIGEVTLEQETLINLVLKGEII